MIQIVAFAIGMMIGVFLDFVYFQRDFNKYERGFEAIEHYHIGILFGVIGVIINQPILLGIMIALIFKESDQAHAFAKGSNHFKSSTYIGIGTLIWLSAVILL